MLHFLPFTTAAGKLLLCACCLLALHAMQLSYTCSFGLDSVSLIKLPSEPDSDSVSANLRQDCTPRHLVQEMISENKENAL